MNPRYELAHQRARRHAHLHEQRDLHEADQTLEDALLKTGDIHPAFKQAMFAHAGESIIGNGRKLKTIKGMGTVYDWRDSPWTPANGGRINPLFFVQHIPVVPNVKGIGDFVTLRNVLVAQGLMVQTATDSEGNVALYTPFDVLCYQARGANQLSTGCEHMHYLTSEAWSRKQLRASAWLAQLAERKHGIPQGLASLGNGNGVVRVNRKGHTGHRRVSAAAGFNDRSDPGSGYDYEYVRACVRFFERHGHFSGA